MRRPGVPTFLLILLAAGSANATMIVTGGGPAAAVRGSLQAFAQDPLVIDQNDSYDESKSDPNGNGSIPNGGNDFVAQSLAEFDGEATVVGSSASASYGYQFGHTAGSLSSGSIMLSSYTAMSTDGSYFAPDPNDPDLVYALAYGRAEAVDFMDLDIVGTDYLLDFSGLVQDDSAQIDSIVSNFFSVADITSGFDVLAFYTDDTTNDFTPTAFADSLLLLAGRQYRIGIGSATDYLCTATSAALCPALDQNGDPVASAPQDLGFYGQSGSVQVDFTLTAVAVPEPGTALLVATGLALLGARRRR